MNRVNGRAHRSWALLRKSPDTIEAEASAPYRRLAAQLHQDLPRGAASRSVLIAAPSEGEYCGPAGMQLAQSLAELVLRPVLVVDASLRAPTATRMLGCVGRPGLADALSSGDGIARYTLTTSSANVAFLPVGSPSVGVAPVTGGIDGVVRLLAAAEQAYDFVVIVGGSLLTDVLALAFAPIVGCTLLVAVEDRSKLAELDAARDTLVHCKAQRIGLVLATPSR